MHCDIYLRLFYYPKYINTDGPILEEYVGTTDLMSVNTSECVRGNLGAFGLVKTVEDAMTLKL